MFVSISIVKSYIKNALANLDDADNIPDISSLRHDIVCLFIDYLTLHPNAPASELVEFVSKVLNLPPENIQCFLEVGSPNSAIGREITRDIGKSDIPRFTITPGFEHLRGTYAITDETRHKQSIFQRNKNALTNLGIFLNDAVSIHGVKTPENCEWIVVSLAAPLGYVQVSLYNHLSMQVEKLLYVEILRLHKVGSSLFETMPLNTFLESLKHDIQNYILLSEKKRKKKKRKHKRKKRNLLTHFMTFYPINYFDNLEISADEIEADE